MKKTLFLFLVLFSALNSADAQWYERSCGVTDLNSITAEEFDCLWTKATKTARFGAITTGIGTSLMAVGGIVIIASHYGQAAYTGLSMIMIGAIIDLVGVPVWMVGATRKSELSINPHYNNQQSGILRLAPTINRNQFNSTYSIGLSASLSF